jgi:hypothetical protein
MYLHQKTDALIHYKGLSLMAHLSETVAHSEPEGWLTLTGQAAQNGPNYSKLPQNQAK